MTLWLSIAVLLFSSFGLIVKAAADARFNRWKKGKDLTQIESRKICQIKWLATLNLVLLGLTAVASATLIGVEKMSDNVDATQLSALEKRVEELERFVRGPRPPGGGPTLEDQFEALNKKIDDIAGRLDSGDNDIEELRRSIRKIWETMKAKGDRDRGDMQTG